MPAMFTDTTEVASIIRAGARHMDSPRVVIKPPSSYLSNRFSASLLLIWCEKSRTNRFEAEFTRACMLLDRPLGHS